MSRPIEVISRKNHVPGTPKAPGMAYYCHHCSREDVPFLAVLADDCDPGTQLCIGCLAKAIEAIIAPICKETSPS